jgi:hypothetical protein
VTETLDDTDTLGVTDTLDDSDTLGVNEGVIYKGPTQ